MREEAEQQALNIYETICASSGDRPFAFQSVGQMHRDIAAWRASNAGLGKIKQASPEVLLAFLSESVEWLKAESKEHSNFRITSTIVDAILQSLQEVPKPLPNDLVLRLLTETFRKRRNAILLSAVRVSVRSQVRAGD